jgi:hypothetical protein
LIIIIIALLVISQITKKVYGDKLNIKSFIIKLMASVWGIVIGYLLLLIACIVLTVAIMNLGAPIKDITDAVQRIGLIWTYIQGQILVQEPWQGYALWGWLLVLILAVVRQKQDELVLALALALYFPFLYLASVPTNVQFGIRNFQTLLWLSYLVLGFLIVWIINQIGKYSEYWIGSTQRSRLTGGLFVVIFTLLLINRINLGFEFLARKCS